MKDKLIKKVQYSAFVSALFFMILGSLIFVTKEFAIPAPPGGNTGGGGTVSCICNLAGGTQGPIGATATCSDGSSLSCQNFEFCNSNNTTNAKCAPATCSCNTDGQTYTCTTSYYNGSSLSTYTLPSTCPQGNYCPTSFQNVLGNPCRSSGAIGTPTPPVPGNPVGTNPGGGPVSSDPCALTQCGDGYYCGGECGATGQPGTRYQCQNNKMIGLDNCGCQYCPIGQDACTNTNPPQQCINNACENQGGTCYSNNGPEVKNTATYTVVTNAVCENSQLQVLPNMVCLTSGQNNQFGQACSNGATSGPISGICRPKNPGCLAYGEVEVVNSADCNKNASPYICCSSQNANNNFGYNDQTACVSPSSSGMCVKGADCSSRPETTLVQANTNAASCVGSGLTVSDFVSAANGGTPISCCVPNSASKVAGPVTYSCDNADATAYDDNAGNVAGHCQNGQICDPNATVKPGDPPCRSGTGTSNNSSNSNNNGSNNTGNGGQCSDGTTKGMVCVTGGQCAAGFVPNNGPSQKCNYGSTCCIPGDINVTCSSNGQSGRCQALTVSGTCPSGQQDALGVDVKGNRCAAYGPRYTCCLNASSTIPNQPPVQVFTKPHFTCEHSGDNGSGNNGYMTSDTGQHAGYCTYLSQCNNITDPSDPNIKDLASCAPRTCSMSSSQNGFCADSAAGCGNLSSLPFPGGCGSNPSGLDNICCFGKPPSGTPVR